MKALLILASLLTHLAFAAQAPKGALVVNTKAKSISLVDLLKNKELGRLEVGNRPYGVVINADETAFAVGVEGDEILKFYSLSNFKPIGEYKVGPMHHDHLVLSKDKKDVLIANFYSDSMIAVNFNSHQESYRIKGLSAPHVVKYGPKRDRAYLTLKKITGIGVIEAKRGGNKRIIPLKVNPRSLTFSPDEKFAYFGSFWVDGFFELNLESGKVSRLFSLPAPKSNSIPREVTYHGVEFVGSKYVAAANEGRSYLDLVDTKTGALADRLESVSNPCCIETVEVGSDKTTLLVSNLGNNSVEKVLVKGNRLYSTGTISVGEAPKRVAFLYKRLPKAFIKKIN